jgi:glycosyltransferase involved in cell wall biosynthesis
LQSIKSSIVITPHGAYNEIAMQRSQWIKKIYFHAFEKTILKHAHKVHSIGKSEVEGLEKIYPNAKSFLLPYGFEANTAEVSVSKNKDFTIGFVGRLDTHTKGLDLLMEAFYQFQKTEVNSKLWIIGDGEGRDFLEQFILEKKLNNVVLWGKKFGKEKDELISQMHVFAHPSRNEGLPTSVLEAASFGVPSIVSKATNVAEYVTQFQAGIAIDNHSVSQLMSAMDKICKAYAKNEAGKYISGARAMLGKVFDWPILVKKYDELYN